MWNVPRWVKSCLLILLVGVLTACQGREPTSASPVGSSQQGEEKKSESFRPYSDPVVPRLKELMGRKGFKRYTMARPYLLGYSYDGTFAATVVYEPRAQAYRIDLFHTGTHKLEESVYAPDEIANQNASSSVNRDSSRNEEEELLALTQETLDLGYRVKVPSTPRNFFTGLAIRTPGEKSLKFTVKQEAREVILGVEQDGDRWELTRFPLGKGERLASRWMVSSPPSPGQKWTVVASVQSPGHGLRPLVYTLDASFLTPDWTEARLQERLKAVLGKGSRIVFRGETASHKGPEVFLAVQGGESFTFRSGEGVGFSGTADRFVILDPKGQVLLRGNAAGLVRDEQVLLEPSIPKDSGTRFRLLLSEKEGKQGKSLRMLTVDQLNGQGRTVKTYELHWHPKKKKFQYE